MSSSLLILYSQLTFSTQSNMLCRSLSPSSSHFPFFSMLLIIITVIIFVFILFCRDIIFMEKFLHCFLVLHRNTTQLQLLFSFSFSPALLLHHFICEYYFFGLVLVIFHFFCLLFVLASPLSKPHLQFFSGMDSVRIAYMWNSHIVCT